jgi:hypothetical protein
VEFSSRRLVWPKAAGNQILETDGGRDGDRTCNHLPCQRSRSGSTPHGARQTAWPDLQVQRARRRIDRGLENPEREETGLRVPIA